ncbi:hypothetical protein C8J57DRAFT_1244236 [Mycena rebaudengoi]|nr:hypothetical protein C8J57DRAFT_1244236 [Mycena rebaudengoi]
MLIKLVPPAPHPTVLFALSFPELPPHLPTPPSWTSQLSLLALDDLEVPRTVHALDRAAGIPSLLDEVVFDLTMTGEEAVGYGGRVECRFLDGKVERWDLPYLPITSSPSSSASHSSSSSPPPGRLHPTSQIKTTACLTALASVVRDVNASARLAAEEAQRAERARQRLERQREADLIRIREREAERARRLQLEERTRQLQLEELHRLEAERARRQRDAERAAILATLGDTKIGGSRGSTVALNSPPPSPTGSLKNKGLDKGKGRKTILRSRSLLMALVASIVPSSSSTGSSSNSPPSSPPPSPSSRYSSRSSSPSRSSLSSPPTSPSASPPSRFSSPSPPTSPMSPSSPSSSFSDAQAQAQAQGHRPAHAQRAASSPDHRRHEVDGGLCPADEDVENMQDTRAGSSERTNGDADRDVVDDAEHEPDPDTLTPRLLRRRARSTLVDAFRAHVLGELVRRVGMWTGSGSGLGSGSGSVFGAGAASILGGAEMDPGDMLPGTLDEPGGGYPAWVARSMLRRAEVRMREMEEEFGFKPHKYDANDAYADSHMYGNHQRHRSQQQYPHYFFGASDDEDSEDGEDGSEGSSRSSGETDTDGSSVHTPRGHMLVASDGSAVSGYFSCVEDGGEPGGSAAAPPPVPFLPPDSPPATATTATTSDAITKAQRAARRHARAEHAAFAHMTSRLRGLLREAAAGRVRERREACVRAGVAEVRGRRRAWLAGAYSGDRATCRTAGAIGLGTPFRPSMLRWGWVPPAEDATFECAGQEEEELPAYEDIVRHTAITMTSTLGLRAHALAAAARTRAKHQRGLPFVFSELDSDEDEFGGMDGQGGHAHIVGGVDIDITGIEIEVDIDGVGFGGEDVFGAVGALVGGRPGKGKGRGSGKPDLWKGIGAGRGHALAV